MMAHGGTSVAGSFIQTLTMVDIATGWTECAPLVRRDGALVVEAIKYLQGQFPWLLIGVDFDNDSAFMNDVVIPWCCEQKLEVTRLRGYKKNDQAFVEQKNGAVVHHGSTSTSSSHPFKLKEKRREGSKVIKRYHAPLTPSEPSTVAVGSSDGTAPHRRT
jgi:hypothetical protein